MTTRRYDMNYRNQAKKKKRDEDRKERKHNKKARQRMAKGPDELSAIVKDIASEIELEQLGRT